MTRDNEILQVDVFDDQRCLSIDELIALCGVQRSLIEELVYEGVLEPADIRAPHWQFSGSCIRRVRLAVRLQRDLDLNVPAVALVLDLLEELEELRRRIRRR